MLLYKLQEALTELQVADDAISIICQYRGVAEINWDADSRALKFNVLSLVEFKIPVVLQTALKLDRLDVLQLILQFHPPGILVHASWNL